MRGYINIVLRGTVLKTVLKKKAPVLTRVQLKRLNIGELYWNASYDQIPKHAAYKMFVGRYLVKLETVINKGIGLYLWGDNSRGKTYIAAIICKAAVEKGYTAYMILADDLKSAVIERLLFMKIRQLCREQRMLIYLSWKTLEKSIAAIIQISSRFSLKTFYEPGDGEKK